MRRPDSLAELNATARQVATASGGLLSVDIVRPTDFLPLLTAALTGDHAAARLVEAAGDAVARIASMPHGAPALCACCPGTLVPGHYAVAIATPASEAPAKGIALGICADCATEPSDLLTKAREGLARIWPSLRAVAVTHSVGGQA